MHPHENHPVLQPSDLLASHFCDLLHISAQELFPSSPTPKEFTWRDRTCLVNKKANYSRVEIQLERLGAVLAWDLELVCIDGNPAAMLKESGVVSENQKTGNRPFIAH
jgi:hypothetical protein